MSVPIKIYVGTQVEQRLAVDVLTYSIAQHTQQPCDVIPLYEAVQTAGIDIPTPSDPQLRPRTPFTFQRFAIPALCGYQGRAIYLDSDMLVLKDIDLLWQHPFAGADLLSVPEPEGSTRSPQYSVMLLNCEQLDWDVVQLVNDLIRGKWTYQQFVLEMAPAERKTATLPPGWNELECYTPGHSALVHYTDMPRQPWLSIVNSHADLWCDVLLRAISEGAITREAVRDSVDKGWVRPSLLYQVDHGLADPQQIPTEVLRRDAHTFTPPHVWQRYLRAPMLQGKRSRQVFSRTYSFLKATRQKVSRG